MYKVIIELKKDVSLETASRLKTIIEGAFDNRLGKIDNVSNNAPYGYVFEDETRECLEFGVISFDDIAEVKDNADAIMWIDEDPEECCNMLEAFAKVTNW